MLVVVVLLFASTVAVPALQSVVFDGADDLPFGLDAGRGDLCRRRSCSASFALFALLCLVYRLVPN